MAERKFYIKHGKSKTSEYKSWAGMKERCCRPNHPAYKNYGARGITVCDRWLESFENFLEDMGSKPTAEHSIDRVDNSKGYSPENCKWATNLEQGNNTRRIHFISYKGETKSLRAWARESKVKLSTFSQRFYTYKWSFEQCLTIEKGGHIGNN